MSKLFFYRIDAGQLLAELVKLKSYEEKGKFAEQLALDLVDGKGNLPFSKAVIAEAKKFSAKKSEAGKKGMKNRWLRDNSVITKDNSDIAVLPDVITNAVITRRSRSTEEYKNICGEQSSPPVAPKKRTKKPSSPESVKLIYVEEYWKWVYSSCEERDYIFSYARDRKLLKGVLSAAGNMAWKVCSLMGAYISDPKRWPTNQPPTIPAFVNAVSRYTENQCPDDYLPPDGEEWGDWQPWRERDGEGEDIQRGNFIL